MSSLFRVALAVRVISLNLPLIFSIQNCSTLSRKEPPWHLHKCGARRPSYHGWLIEAGALATSLIPPLLCSAFSKVYCRYLLPTCCCASALLCRDNQHGRNAREVKERETKRYAGDRREACRPEVSSSTLSDNSNSQSRSAYTQAP